MTDLPNLPRRADLDSASVLAALLEVPRAFLPDAFFEAVWLVAAFLLLLAVCFFDAALRFDFACAVNEVPTQMANKTITHDAVKARKFFFIFNPFLDPP